MNVYFVKARAKLKVSAKSAMAQVRQNAPLVRHFAVTHREEASATTLKVFIAVATRARELPIQKKMSWERRITSFTA
jgi:hypothetical protein